MRFGKINHYVILGGGPFVAFLCKELHQRNKKFSVFYIATSLGGFNRS